MSQFQGLLGKLIKDQSPGCIAYSAGPRSPIMCYGMGMRKVYCIGEFVKVTELEVYEACLNYI